MKMTTLPWWLVYLLFSSFHVSCHSQDAVQNSLDGSIIGAWYDEFDDNVFVVFFPNGTALFSFVTPPEKPLSEWHQKGTWIEVRSGAIEVTFRNTIPIEKEIYTIHQRLKDVLISPNGSSLRRISKPKNK